MPVIAEAYVEHFDYNVTQNKEELYNQVPKEFQSYMKVENTTRPFERRTYTGGLGLPIKNQDYQPIPFQDPPKGQVSVFVPVTYRIGYMIDRQSIEDELFGILANRPKSMLYGSVVIQDMVAANILNNGLTLQSYDLGGVALFAANHLREDAGAVWSNVIPEIQPITTETVFNAIQNMLKLLTDSNGLPISYAGGINLIVPANNPVLLEQAISVVHSTMNPGTADNRINAATQHFNIKVVESRYLTNPNVWFVAWDPSSPGYGLVLFNRVSPTITPLKPFGDNDDVWFSVLRMRFTAGYENQRGIGAVGA